MTDARDVRPLIHQCNAAIVALKRTLRRPHDDTAPAVQRRLHRLRSVATVLHVHQATRRARLHGGLFDSLDAQRDWLTHRWRDDLAEVLTAA
jgi:hypothetical protein